MPIKKGRRPGTHRVYVFANGRQKERIVEGTVAQAKLVEAKLQLELGSRPKGRQAPTLTAFCAHQYSVHAETRLGARTWANRIYQIKMLCRLVGSVRLDQFDSATVETVQRARLEEGHQPSTINGDVRVLLTILRTAMRQGLSASVPEIKPLATSRPRTVAWSHDQVRRVYACARRLDPILVPMIHFLLDTGCRKGELLAAGWDWVDLERRMLRIPVTRYWRPKNKRAREVPLSTSLAQWLARAPRGHARVFVTSMRQAYLTFPDARLRAILRAAGVAGSAHTTRHTYASHFLAEKPSLPLLAKVLGHSTTRVTELYEHMLPDYLEQARDVVQLAPPGMHAPRILVAPGGPPSRSHKQARKR